ncbi:hypothetical protein PM3016_2572 [Paenibacillus mucilaginosus 3016]|uniref:Uncharacterized protein n=2 Tax=Paenibacillus mucilaginosus TaxID=61624 RepID=H6NCX4_9BACL|nr:hypothetical protein [Paenibacillus mucilaginosus]AFC29456.1 hypothetical protein PM3016_2572 [Paenibacillus mucilaginosus 3016]AFH61633.1 hypothetical protein B2K_13045 [Paenibacillus mucilaginosus K02]WFA18165.1 hypothetical protein ERY13_13245 [Paenibacillus mucilaginosus]
MLYGSTESIPYRQAWEVQKVEPELYFGQEIRIVGFIVRDHPPERIYGLKTCVYLMINGGKVIGGHAFPAGEGMAGAYYTLDGKTWRK